jgi:hypothetical protein
MKALDNMTPVLLIIGWSKLASRQAANFDLVAALCGEESNKSDCLGTGVFICSVSGIAVEGHTSW